MAPTILDEEKSIEFLQAGIDNVQRWEELMVSRNVFNWGYLMTALMGYLEAIKYNPYHQQAWTNIAYVFHLIGMADMAERCLQRSYELAKPDPNHPGDNYKKVERAIKSNSYLSGGTVNRPAILPTFEKKFEKDRMKIEMHLSKTLEKPTKPVKKILILSANPRGTGRRRFDEEVREIEECLRRSGYRDRFEIHSIWAVRLRDLRRALLENEPQIVHFCGHGNQEGLLVEDESGLAATVSTEALSGLFKLFSSKVECVVLNACYSETQAAAISQHIDYVIGMQMEIKDKAAIEFSVGFYDALGAGRTVEDAFEFGCNAIRLFNIPDYLIPVLKKRVKKDKIPVD